MNQIRLSRVLVVFVLVKKMGKEENKRSDVYKFVHVWGSEGVHVRVYNNIT